MRQATLILIAIGFLVNSHADAQITRTGNFVANNPSIYPITGDVLLTSERDTLTVDFGQNFATVQGITLEVFLTKTPVLDVINDVKISDAPLDEGSPSRVAITGARQFAVPAGVKAFDFNYVIVQCTSVNMLWGHANLCAKELSLTVAELPADNYKAGTLLSTSSAITLGADVNLNARDSIKLLQGFQVSGQSQLNAIVGEDAGCVLDPE